MKINNTKLKFLFTFLALAVSINTHQINKAYATVPVVDGPLTAAKLASNAKEFAYQIKDTMSQIYTGVQTYTTVINTLQNLKNFDLSTFAKNMAGNLVGEYAKEVQDQIKANDDVKNVLKGAAVVSDAYQQSKNILNNAGNDVIKILKNGENIYTAKSLQDIAKYYKENVNNLTPVANQLFTLPAVVQKEICSSEQLKKTITSGASSFLGASKAAVDWSGTGYKNIEDLCSKSVVDLKAQGALIALYTAGYAGSESRLAAANPNNTPQGQSQLAKAEVDKKVAADKEAERVYNEDKAKTTTCVDENGNEVSYGSTDSGDTFSTNSGKTCSKQIIANINDTAGHIEAAEKSTVQGSINALITQQNSGGFGDIMSVLNNVLAAGKGGDSGLGIKVSPKVADMFNSFISQESLNQKSYTSAIAKATGKPNSNGDLSQNYLDLINLETEKLNYYSDVVKLLNKLSDSAEELPTLRSLAGKKGCPVPMTSGYGDDGYYSYASTQNYFCSDSPYLATINLKAKSCSADEYGNQVCGTVIKTNNTESQEISTSLSYADNKIGQLGEIIKSILVNIEDYNKDLKKYKKLKEAVENSEDKSLIQEFTSFVSNAPNSATLKEEEFRWKLQSMPAGYEANDSSEERKLLNIKNQAVTYLLKNNCRKSVSGCSYQTTDGTTFATGYIDIIKSSGGSYSSPTDTYTSETVSNTSAPTPTTNVPTSGPGYSESDYCKLVFGGRCPWWR